MTRYDKIKTFDIDNMAWFLQTIIDDTENNMLNKLSEYGVDVSLATLDPQIRHAKMLADLLTEVDDGADT